MASIGPRTSRVRRRPARPVAPRCARSTRSPTAASRSPRAIRGFVGATADGYRVGAPQDAAAFQFKPTGLGTYMLSDQDGKLVGLGDPAVRADAPNQSA